jgi:diacylglycerol kinase family enzyme
LLYNPVSGNRPEQRRAILERVAVALRARNTDVEVIRTEAPASAGSQATDACARGADIVFACGGDGTIHDTLQGMVFQPHAALGVLPLGSANALARHLRLHLDPVRAALQQLDRTPRIVPVGHITCQTSDGPRERYFTVMAGAGPDGALVYKMLARGKQSLGRSAYYLRAARLFLGSRFAPFTLTCTPSGAERVASFRAASAMAVRVGDLGGLFSPLVRGGSLEHSHMVLAAALPPARFSLPAWFASSWTRLGRLNPYVRTLHVDGFHCGTDESQPVQVQADGEWIGQTPMTVKLVPGALRLLLP